MTSTTIQDVKRHLWLHGTVSTETDPNELLRDLLAEHEHTLKLLRLTKRQRYLRTSL